MADIGERWAVFRNVALIHVDDPEAFDVERYQAKFREIFSGFGVHEPIAMGELSKNEDGSFVTAELVGGWHGD